MVMMVVVVLAVVVPLYRHVAVVNVCAYPNVTAPSVVLTDAEECVVPVIPNPNVSAGCVNVRLTVSGRFVAMMVVVERVVGVTQV